MIKIFAVFSVILMLPLSACKTVRQTETEQSAPAPAAEPAAEKENDEEYLRSTQDVSVSKEEFSSDKKDILGIIEKLAVIMAEYDYDSWLEYIEPESLQYYSNPVNLRNASKRLPVKGQRLNSLKDYFVFVFVPSRKNHVVDEIRYLSKDSVKVVQTNGSQDIVYYNFTKINEKWMIRIPPLES